MTALLDANVLIALATPTHIHHDAAEAWLASNDQQFATCPITQGSLVRFALREGKAAQTVQRILLDITSNPRHVFWPDSIGYDSVDLNRILGHRQVTDTYLAQLARVNGGRLATFDRPLASAHPDAVELVT
jgi:toxin-antitoxin system PIN domain toxin